MRPNKANILTCYMWTCSAVYRSSSSPDKSSIICNYIQFIKMPNKSFTRSETADDDGYHSHTLESAQITNIVLELSYDCLFCLLFLTVKNPSSCFITLRMPNIKMHEMYNYGMLHKKCGCGVSACLFSLISGSTIKN